MKINGNHCTFEPNTCLEIRCLQLLKQTLIPQNNGCLYLEFDLAQNGTPTIFGVQSQVLSGEPKDGLTLLEASFNGFIFREHELRLVPKRINKISQSDFKI